MDTKIRLIRLLASTQVFVAFLGGSIYVVNMIEPGAQTVGADLGAPIFLTVFGLQAILGVLVFAITFYSGKQR